jgi:hypothetical protein
MSHSQIQAVFPNYTQATGAIESLLAAGFAPRQFSVVGSDSDNFRASTATLQSRRADKMILAFGVFGALLGCLAGFMGMPHIPAREVSNVMTAPLMAAFSGMALGILTATYISFILKIDELAPSDAQLKLGAVHNGDMVITITAKNSTELEKAQTLMREFGTTYLVIDYAQTALQDETGEVLPIRGLTKSA